MSVPKGTRIGGRQKGTPNKAPAERAAAIAASGLTPLDYLLSVLRNKKNALQARVEAAKAAAPYVHSRLATVEVTGKDGGPMQVKIVRFTEVA